MTVYTLTFKFFVTETSVVASVTRIRTEILRCCCCHHDFSVLVRKLVPDQHEPVSIVAGKQ